MDDSDSSDDTRLADGGSSNVHRSNLIRCGIAMILIASVLVIGFAVTRHAAMEFEQDASLISRVGRQRMLLTSAALSLERLLDAKTDEQRRQWRDQLKNDVNAISDVHREIFLPGPGQQPELPREVVEILSSDPHRLQSRIDEFVSLMKRIQATPDAQLRASHPDVANIQRGNTREQLLQAEEAVMDAFTSDILRSHVQLMRTKWIVLICGLVTVALTAVGVFLPMLRQVDRETVRMKQAKSKMNAQKKELADALQALELERDDRRGRMRAMRNVMEDLQAERERLKASEHRYQDLYDNSPDFYVTVNTETSMIEQCNQTLATALGLSKEDIVGDSVYSLYHADCIDSVRQAFDELQRTGSVKNAELQLQRADGSKIDVILSVSAVRDADGKIVRSRSVCRDVTDRKRLEARFRATVESAPTAMVMIDQAGRIVLVNRETEELFGYTRDELMSESIEKLVPRRFRQEHPGHRQHFFRDPESRRMGAGRDLFALKKDGSEFPVEIGLNPIRTDEGVFVLSVIADITERKSAENEIKRVNTELQSKNLEMQQFVYTVSHDLKSPLVTCKGFVGLLREDAEAGRTEQMLDSVHRIERATERMSAMIDDLLQLSRIGTIRNEPEQIDVAALLDRLVEEMSTRITNSGARVTVADDLPPVFADRVRLNEVFENLITNSLKYGRSEDPPWIHVGGTVIDGETRYFVQDNGPGIPPEFHDKIFALFQRLATEHDGTGVGLAAVSRIMQVHGGRCWVESESGNGATFWIAFPHRSRQAG